MALLRSFRFAFEGLVHLLRTQRNARIHVVIAGAALVIAAWLQLPPAEWAILVLTIALVISLEILNTAMELAVTLASPEIHPMAKAAKDLSAAMVFVAAVASLLVGMLLFVPRLLARAG
ncbi:MAG TPA: diacylglycerol kinase family protein [Candidatus Limnocylindria bacterium]|nr:diacylglycerol kinase family protein [Candidatus Limnocylindria bacterium]